MAPAWKLRHDLEWIGHADFHRVRPGAGHKPVVPASAVAKPSTLASESKPRDHPKDNIARRMDALSASAASLAAAPTRRTRRRQQSPFHRQCGRFRTNAPLLFLHFHAAAQRFIKRNGVLRNLSSRNDQFILQRQQ